MGKLIYKSYTDDELIKAYKDVLDDMEKLGLTRHEYTKLEKEYEEIKKELRSRGIRI